ncbi:unnamed protein product [Brachionus calyciflorus]|uniref:Structure-specific endonuclease subunit SLX4 n=1 Tax=Brachionus calyciflorus TaxID=104777 RepID=A0A814DNH2_9BILA|nr:unnamed protein product [Brachionus calyciflorus]
MDETFDEFRENFKILKEKRQHQQQAQISKFLSPLPRNNSLSQSSDSGSFSSSNESSNSKISLHKLSESIDIPKTQIIKKQKSASDSKTDISKYFKKPENETEDFKCPICSKELGKLNESERDKHVNQCLDRKDYLNFEYKPTNKFKRGNSEETENSPEKINSKKTKAEEAPKTSKQVDSTPEQSSIDHEEKHKKLNESLLKDAVPNCPICGKVLHNFNIRQSHLKKCSQVFHIKTESLVELVKKQQEKIEREIAKGLIPTDVYIPKTKKPKEEKPEKKNKITNRVIKLELPTSKQEEQLQIAIALSNSLNPAEDCPKQAEIKLLKANKKLDKKGASIESVLLLTDDETRSTNLSSKFASLLEKQIKYDFIENQKENYFVKTKFKSEKNYLWNKCKYFKETEENFYVQIFLDTGRFTVGHQVFIDKTDQEKFANIEVINTQTAYLLADLNDQTQENLSIYYTQHQSQFNQSQFNQTQIGYQTLDSICDDNDIEKSQSQSINQKFDNTEDQQIEIDKESEVETSPAKQIENIISNSEFLDQEIENQIDTGTEDISLKEEKSLVEEKKEFDCLENSRIEKKVLISVEYLEGESNQIEFDNQQNCEMSQKSQRLNFLMNETIDENQKDNSIREDEDSLHEATGLNDRAVFIDETQLSSPSSTDKNNSNIHVENLVNEEVFIEESSDSNDKNSNILDQNILMDESEVIIEDEIVTCEKKESELNKKDEENKEKLEEVIISDDSDESNKCSNKKRKSLDVIELSDSSGSLSPHKIEPSKKFKPDLNEVVEMDEIEIISNDCIIDTNKDEKFKKNEYIFNESSSSSLPNLDNDDFEINDDKISDENEQIVESEKDEHENENRQILDLLEKSQKFDDFNQNNDDALDEVWQNFGENQFDNYCEINYIENIDNFQNNDPCDLEPVCEIQDPIQLIDKNDDFQIITPQKYSTNNKQKHKDQDSEEDICEFIKNYRDVQSKNDMNNKKDKSQNSTLDEEDLENLNSDSEEPAKKTVHKKNGAIKPPKEPANSKISLNVPNFSSMDTPDLKNELKKFGVKALPKKQAVKKLTEIYEFTNRKQNKTSVLPRSQSCMNFKTNSSQMKTSNSITGISSKVVMEKSVDEDCDEDLESMAKIMNLEFLGSQATKKKVPLKKTMSDIGAIRSTQSSSQSSLLKIGSKTSKKAKNLEKTMDERMMEMVEEDDEDDASEASESQKKTGKILKEKEKIKKTLDEEETRQCVFNLIKSDDNLYLSVLNYEPLDYEQFFTNLQTSLAPRKCNNKILMKVLDEYCVTFTLKNLNTRGNSKVRTKKKH